MEADHWGFPAVLELISSLSTARINENHRALPQQEKASLRSRNDALGNFEPVWDFLGHENLSVETTLFSQSLECSTQGNGLTKHSKELESQYSSSTEKPLENGLDDSAKSNVQPIAAKSNRQLRKESRKAEKKRLCEIEKEKKRIEQEKSQNEATEQRTKIIRALLKDVGQGKAKPAKPINGRSMKEVGSEEHLNVPQNLGVDSPFKQLRSEQPLFSPSKGEDLASAPAKKKQLFNLLYTRFRYNWSSPKDFIFAPATVAPGAQTGREIHVFIDMSNILIGFHDALKTKRGIKKWIPIPRMQLSFHNLSLILERGRPTVKRVLVGSDDIDSTQEAKSLGYETNILARVQKFRPYNNRYQNGTSGASSGSDSQANRGQLKKVEQAVDEILHLKMSQSVLDTETPSTMVLATGDAAEAEYSDGFLRTAERALKRGWKLELVAFKQNISYAYRNPVWTAIWGSSFRIIELDDYVELLLVE